jgi:hypothetical protein
MASKRLVGQRDQHQHGGPKDKRKHPEIEQEHARQMQLTDQWEIDVN